MDSSSELFEDDLLPEYRFDYSKGKPNPYANRVKVTRMIQLDVDVAEVFTSADSVNTALRALITAMPKVVQKTVD